ncbi:MAG: alpha/beta hydrolase [Rhizobacter sp.]
MSQPTVRRDALYLGDEAHPLFASFHTAEGVAARDSVAVICNPLGYEYVHSHRTLRHLADDLARIGVPALRFDYDGTGDSPGTDMAPERLTRWLQDIQTAMAVARTLSGRSRVCLIGLRLGATLAALTASRTPVDSLVLWSPCVSGRRYVREMQALAQAAGLPERADAGTLESAGFLMSAETQQELKAIQVLGLPAQVSRGALIVARDDMNEDHHLSDHLRSLGVATDVLTFAGYADMMAEPQKTVVPRAAIEDIVRWVVAHTQEATEPLPASLHRSAEPTIQFTSADGSETRLTETACRFGEGGYLAGIHCQAQGGDHLRPTVVLFNSGVVHRIGPNRLYVDLARSLATLGFSTFRCDIEGIGDSVLRGEGRENHPYPDTADRDAAVALRFLTERFGAQEFVLMGLCSGAYTSFNAGLGDGAWPIAELVLINPLTFRWQEGDVLDTQHYRVMAHYKGTMRRLDSWKKLLRGQVNLIHLGGVVLSYLRKQLGSYGNALAERWFPSAGPLLSRQLRQLFSRGRRVSLFIASGDPGWDMLTSKARHTASQAQKRGDLAVRFIADADHTFSSEDSRRRLLAGVREHLLQRFKLR